jgi:hypothetical protein
MGWSGGQSSAFFRPGADAADLDRERFECQFEALKAVVSIRTKAGAAEASGISATGQDQPQAPAGSRRPMRLAATGSVRFRTPARRPIHALRWPAAEKRQGGDRRDHPDPHHPRHDGGRAIKSERPLGLLRNPAWVISVRAEMRGHVTHGQAGDW